MKKILVTTVLLAGAAGAQADGYIGATVGRGKLAFDCAQDATCKQSINVFKLYAGTRLKEASQLDLGIAKIDALEVGYQRSGSKAVETKIVEQNYLLIDPDNGNTASVRMVPQRRLVSYDALVLAPVVRASLTREIDLFIKPGAAVVSTTVRTVINGVGQQSETQTKLKPYLSVGGSVAIAGNVRMVGAFDWMPVSSVGSVTGSTHSFNLGAEASF